MGLEPPILHLVTLLDVQLQTLFRHNVAAERTLEDLVLLEAVQPQLTDTAVGLPAGRTGMGIVLQNHVQALVLAVLKQHTAQ